MCPLLKSKSEGRFTTRNAASLFVVVSNDAGRTQSNQLEVIFRTELPRLSQLTKPDLLFADNERIDVIISGTGFYPGMVLMATKVDDTNSQRQ